MDLSTRPLHSFLNEDQRWIGPGGIESAKAALSVTLNAALFDLVTAFPNKLIPSGVALGKVTATGLYGPYAPAASDGRQTAAGLLLVSESIDPLSTNNNHPVALYWRGMVIQSYLPANNGVDAAAITALQRILFT